MPPSGPVRYDGHADWYDAYLTGPAADHTARVGAELARLLGRGTGGLLDVGCGTGGQAGDIRRLGWRPVGIDLSPDQLRLARSRLPVACAEAGRLPVRAASVRTVVATLIHTDLDDWDAFVREAARVLCPGGRLVYVGVHPCFVGPFAQRAGVDGGARLHPGYRSSALAFAGPGIGTGVRPRVGVRHRTLEALLAPVTAAGLALRRLTEPDGPDPPDLLGFAAERLA